MQRGDIELMRGAHGCVRVATITSTSTMAVSPNDRRVALVFTGPQTGSFVTISTEPNTNSGEGLLLTPGMVLHITLDSHGDAVKKPWYAVSSGGSGPFGYLEVMLDG